MSYQKAHYDAVLKPYQALFKIANHDLEPGQWIYNRRKIKAMLDDLAAQIESIKEQCSISPTHEE